jgi:hypothetical protein
MIYEFLSIRKFAKEDITDYRAGFDEAIILKEYENDRLGIIDAKVVNKKKAKK